MEASPAHSVALAPLGSPLVPRKHVVLAGDLIVPSRGMVLASVGTSS